MNQHIINMVEQAEDLNVQLGDQILIVFPEGKIGDITTVSLDPPYGALTAKPVIHAPAASQAPAFEDGLTLLTFFTAVSPGKVVLTTDFWLHSEMAKKQSKLPGKYSYSRTVTVNEPHLAMRTGS